MAVPDLVTTPGAEDANSYATLAEATAYAESLTGPTAAAWLAASEDVQRQALLTAAIRLDQEGYAGRKATGTQALKWPRYGARDEDGRMYPSDVVPEIVKRAQVDLALSYANGETDPGAPGEMDAYESVTVGPLQVTLRQPQRAGALPEAVKRTLRHVLRTSGSTGRLVRG